MARHTSIDTAERGIKRTFRGGTSAYGWTWVSANEGVDVSREVFAKSQRPWVNARDRAKAEGNYNFVQSEAPCCDQVSVHEWAAHRGTVRHFRYWIVSHKETAMRFWPWIREVMATEILSGVSE